LIVNPEDFAITNDFPPLFRKIDVLRGSMYYDYDTDLVVGGLRPITLAFRSIGNNVSDAVMMVKKRAISRINQANELDLSSTTSAIVNRINYPSLPLSIDFVDFLLNGKSNLSLSLFPMVVGQKALFAKYNESLLLIQMVLAEEIEKFASFHPLSENSRIKLFDVLKSKEIYIGKGSEEANQPLVEFIRKDLFKENQIQLKSFESFDLKKPNKTWQQRLSEESKIVSKKIQ
jgi:hypothetical protein